MNWSCAGEHTEIEQSLKYIWLHGAAFGSMHVVVDACATSYNNSLPQERTSFRNTVCRNIVLKMLIFWCVISRTPSDDEILSCSSHTDILACGMPSATKRLQQNYPLGEVAQVGSYGFMRTLQNPNNWMPHPGPQLNEQKRPVRGADAPVRGTDAARPSKGKPLTL